MNRIQPSAPPDDFLSRVEAATRALRALFPATPLQRNDYLSARYGAEILLKREDLTPVRSYKLRGAFNFFRQMLEVEGRDIDTFVCASAGNHAQGFAWACNHFRKRGLVFMPVTTPPQKVMKTRAFGGDHVEVRLVGDLFEDAARAAMACCAETGAAFVPPFDHAYIIEGQASVAAEILAEPEAPADLVIIPVGGGGLAAGMTACFRAHGAEPDYLFVEPDAAPSLRRSLEAGERVTLEVPDNFVDGASVATMGALPLSWLARFSPDRVRTIPRNRLCQTMMEMLNIEGIVLEPAGALAIDALRDLPAAEIAGKRIVCVVSGGNFDFERIAEVKERALRWAQLKKYFILSMPQRPGALKDFLYLLGPDDDIARFEYLKKSARNFGSVLIGIETTDPQNFEALFARFRERNIRYIDITENDILASLLI